jgi:hypothetical protein
MFSYFRVDCSFYSVTKKYILLDWLMVSNGNIFFSWQTSSSSHYRGSKKCDESGAKEDSDLPKFTLGELRGVLNERNKLKMRLYEMEEELERLCPSSPVYLLSFCSTVVETKL